MKFTVTFKDPDGPADCIADAVKESLADIGLTGDEMEAIIEKRQEKLTEWCFGNFFEYGEYVEIEIDTDAGTARVVPRRDSVAPYV